MRNIIVSLFKDKQFLKLSAAMALPMILQSLLLSGLNMADVVMIGYLSNTDTEIAAVSIANQVSFILYMFFIGISGGTSIFISRYLGSGDEEKARQSVSLGVFATMFFACIVTFLSLFCPEFLLRFFSKDLAVLALGVSYLRIVSLSYLFTSIAFSLSSAIRCTGNSKPPLFASVIGFFVNVTLNYLLIFGKFGFPAMGVRGAATATVIARIIEFLLVLYFTFRKDSIWNGRYKTYFTYQKGFVGTIYKGCLPVLINDLQWGFANLLYCVAYGMIGTHALTVTQVLKNANDLLLVICIGYSNTALIFISKKIGEGNSSVARTYGLYFEFLSFLSGVFLSLILFFFPTQIAGIFGVSGQTLESAATVLRFLAFLFPVRSLAIMLIIGVLRGNGDIKFSLWTELGSMWLIGVPLAFLGVFLGLPVEYVVLLTFTEEIVKAAVALIRQKSGRSIKFLG